MAQSTPHNRKTVTEDQQELNLNPLPVMAGLREIMASSGHAEDKLNGIVRLIASHIGVDVCSIYMMRAGEVLELFATIGLNPEAVHKTRLSVGEGLIGYVAEQACPIRLKDAWHNPHFVHRPETNEEDFQSFCAVPIMREQRVRGVLAIQSRQNSAFSEEVIEVLQNIAMVLAEFIASGEVISRSEMDMTYKPLHKPTQLSGMPFSPGLMIGTAVIHNAQPTVKKIIAENTDLEKKRLRSAIFSMNKAIENMLRPAGVNVNEETRDILESYQMFAKDQGWLKRIEGMIDQGLTADAAVQRAQIEIRSRLTGLDAPVLQEKIHDIDDISGRLLTAMDPYDEDAPQKPERPDKFILVAQSLSPAALFDYGIEHISAIVLTGGSPSGHISIIAKALNIPVMGQCRDALQFIREGDKVIVDSENNLVHINPSDYIEDLHTARIASLRSKQQSYRKRRDVPAVTKDGVEIELLMNAGLLAEIPFLQDSGAQGIGLYRTEISFMGRTRYPLVSEQAEFYGKIMDQAGDKPVTFRTLDIGGDKPLPYFTSPEEENPAMGWRAMRIIVDRPAVLRTQIRALIMAANGRPLRVMLPFVSEVWEVDQAQKLIDMEFRRAFERDIPLPERFDLGVMIEVPSLLWQLESLFRRVSFVAVGTNDLMQYLFASDSRSDMVQDRYDPLSPPMVRALRHISSKARDAGIEVSVCGEMASKPLEAMVLVALGFRSLSMPVHAIGRIKDTINSMKAAQLSSYLNLLAESGSHSLREKLENYAKDHKIKIKT